MYKKQRIEALSDGIFAIVMTLLVLELKIPVDVPQGHLWPMLRQERDSWLSFAITFGIAARYWMLQHRVFELTEQFRHQATMLTFVFLGFVSVLPFSSALAGHHGSEPVAMLLYCLNQAAIGAVLILKLEYIRYTDGLTTTFDMQQLRRKLWSLTAAMALGAIASAIVPLRYIFIAPALVVIAGRGLRQVMKEAPHKQKA